MGILGSNQLHEKLRKLNGIRARMEFPPSDIIVNAIDKIFEHGSRTDQLATKHNGKHRNLCEAS